MAKYRDPYNPKYCKAVNCPSRHGNQCVSETCTRAGNEKRAIYFTQHGRLADGDDPESGAMTEAVAND